MEKYISLALQKLLLVVVMLLLIESQGKLCLIDSGNPESFGTTTYPGADGKKVADYIKSIGGTHLDCIIGTHGDIDSCIWISVSVE